MDEQLETKIRQLIADAKANPGKHDIRQVMQLTQKFLDYQGELMDAVLDGDIDFTPTVDLDAELDKLGLLQ